MEITKDTTIHNVLSAHPGMLDFLAGYASEFEKLRNPVLRNTMARVASLEAAAAMAEVPLERLLEDVQAELARLGVPGAAAESAGAPAAAPGEAPADAPADAPAYDAGRAARQEALKGIVRDLHAGAEVSEVKERFQAIVRDVGPGEIAEMEQALVREGLPVEEVRRLCDVHVEVFRSALDARPAVAPPSGHPADVFRAENDELAARAEALRGALDSLGDPPDTALFEQGREGLERSVDELRAAADGHYVRKENQLFPLLEEHGITAPPKVMWAVHDDIRAQGKLVLEAIAEGGGRESPASTVAGAIAEARRFAGMVDDMIYKEANILLPMALETLGDEDWARVGADSSAPTRAAAPPDGGAALPLTTGSLTPEQLDLMLTTIPLDVTLVDEDDRVAFYSEGHRVFPRSPGIIGRKVQDCHPPKSIDVVQRILDEFRVGAKDTAEFWIRMGDRFVHIRYFALRDADGAYRGVLEVTQDVTGIRSLEGERRLLDW